MEDQIKSVLFDLEHKGWSVQVNFFTPALIHALNIDLEALQQQGALKQAGIGRDHTFNIEQTIRRDEIFWLDPAVVTTAQAEYYSLTQMLQDAINQQFFLGLFELEVHFALYAEGGFYKRHLDQHKNQDTRVLSVITYLNENWLPEDGGELLLYLKTGDPVSVLPMAGTLVCFLSAEFEHEVRVAKRNRASLTGWFRKRTH